MSTQYKLSASGVTHAPKVKHFSHLTLNLATEKLFVHKCGNYSILIEKYC